MLLSVGEQDRKVIEATAMHLQSTKLEMHEKYKKLKVFGIKDSKV